MDEALHPSLHNRGQRFSIQNFPNISPEMSTEDILAKVSLSRDHEKCLLGKHFANGKLVGKTAFMDVGTTYDHGRFIENFIETLGERRRLAEIYNSVHKAFFSNWDNGCHTGSYEFVVYHSGNGLFADIPLFLNEFEGSVFIQPVRNVTSCLASEKRRILTQLIGHGGLGALIKLPD